LIENQGSPIRGSALFQFKRQLRSGHGGNGNLDAAFLTGLAAKNDAAFRFLHQTNKPASWGMMTNEPNRDL
jgi:hypothetical protein